MANVTAKQTINASVSDVWATWNDFGDIYRFNPGLKASRLINDSANSGTGAMRQCDMVDGKNYIRERLIASVPEKSMTIDIYEGTIPVKRAVATLTFEARGASLTEVTMSMDFTPKMGLFGKLLIPMMKPQFRKSLVNLLAGNAAFVERGVEVNAAA